MMLTTFALIVAILENYYFGVLILSLEERSGVVEAQLALEDVEAQVIMKERNTVDDDALAKRILELLASFDTLRHRSRHSMWAGLSFFLFGNAAKYIEMGGVTTVAILGAAALFCGAAVVLPVVYTFRKRYYALMAEGLLGAAAPDAPPAPPCCRCCCC